MSEVAVSTPGRPGKGKRNRRKDLKSVGEGNGGDLGGGGDVLKKSGGEEAYNGLGERRRAAGAEFRRRRVLGPVG